MLTLRRNSLHLFFSNMMLSWVSKKCLVFRHPYWLYFTILQEKRKTSRPMCFLMLSVSSKLTGSSTKDKVGKLSPAICPDVLLELERLRFISSPNIAKDDDCALFF
jgi:hypothetical protein